MSLIVFYNTTELDKIQLEKEMSSLGHDCEYIEEELSADNINSEAEVISVFITSPVTREIIEAMPKLKLVCCRSTGYNHIDLEAAREKNIAVVNVPFYGEATVAEYAFTMLLALTRRFTEVLEAENEPFVSKELTGQDLYGKTFGVIGTGHIGQKALRIANGFSMKALAYDVHPDESLKNELNFSYVSLEKLLAESDFVSIHVPYLPATHHLMNRERLFSMKRGAILINTARGALVDTGALVEVLQQGHLGGAALDVIEGERLLNLDEELALLDTGETEEDTLRHDVEISALKKMPNVIISPHNAYNTKEAIKRINTTTAENIAGFYKDNMQNSVTYLEPKTGKLILVRHTESEWNAKGVWSGITDVPLSEKGEADCLLLAKTIHDLNIKIDVAIYTDQKRTEQTLTAICEALGQPNLKRICEPGFNERNYGEYTGMDKWKVKEDLGEEKFNKIRRGWDVPFPNGETLKEVYERVVPAYRDTVLPMLKNGKNVLIVAHGNSLRALIKYLDSISDEDVEKLEMLMSQVLVYDVNQKSGLKQSVKIFESGTDTTSHF